jgi:ribosomal-protein-serine acetyltransferase
MKSKASLPAHGPGFARSEAVDHEPSWAAAPGKPANSSLSSHRSEGTEARARASAPTAPRSMNLQCHDDFVALRPFRTDDLAKLHAATLETAPLLGMWMTWFRLGYSDQDCESFLTRTAADWAADRAYSFAIVDPDDHALYGSIGLNHVDRIHLSANVGYWVRNTQARRGIASRALRLVAQFGFRELGLGRLELLIPEANIASQRVAQKAGARFEGLLRHKLLLNGTPHDTTIYSLLEGDLRPGAV